MAIATNQQQIDSLNIDIAGLQSSISSIQSSSAYLDCLNNNNCDEFNRLGGDERLMEIDPMVQVPRKTDEIMRKSQEETNPNNTHQDDKSPTDVSAPNITRGADHSGGKKKKNYTNIVSNSQALNEEISTIKYLIEYMNNNKKQNL